MSDPKPIPFAIHTTPYKTIYGVPIRAHIPIPKSMAANPITTATIYQVLVRFYGGFLVMGSALYTEWFPSWLVDFVLTNRAIWVMPNYRLLPEASGREFVENLGCFGGWCGRGAGRG